MDNWLEQEINRPYNEIAQLFPLMEGQDFEELKADIAANGLREAIWLHPDRSILDGRNRHRACIETETRPQFRTWEKQGSLVSFVVSMNLHRRHLSESQRAIVAAKIANLEGPGRPEKITAFAVISQGDAGSLLNVSSDSIQRAKKVLAKGAPELAQAVELDKIAVSLAAKATELPEGKQVKMVGLIEQGVKPKEAYRQVTRPEPVEFETTGKYRVIYADPPWQYGNSGVINNDNYGRAERHYPTMSLDELCKLPIKNMAEDNAVLFLWVTSPLLEECFAVIRAWGFKYKTSFVWDKVKHNFGHYNSVRHEFLLICTRGSCTPDSDKKFDSVVTCERTERHSEKPQEFRKIIDTLYPHGRRIELFAREKFEGWDTWGNEVE